MIDAKTEDLLSLADAARVLPRRRGGKRVHVATVYRWSTCGLRGVALETLQVGGTRCTSREALQSFFERLAAVPVATEPVSPVREERRIEAQLDAYGV